MAHRKSTIPEGYFVDAEGYLTPTAAEIDRRTAKRRTKKTPKRRKKSLGSTERYIVSGPARYKRSHHTSYDAAIKAGHKCSQQFPDAVCKVEHGLPGLQKTVAECNRNECWKVGGAMGKRRRHRKARR